MPFKWQSHLPSRDNFKSLKLNVSSSVFLIIGIVIAFVSLVMLWFILQSFIISGVKEDTFFLIEQGDTGNKIAERLAQAELIKSSFIFKLHLKLSGSAHKIHLGKYSLKKGDDVVGIVKKITKGDVIIHQITIIEGRTVKQITNQLLNNQCFVGDISNSPIEGSLLPQTYNFTCGTPRDEIIERMQVAMERTLERLWQDRDLNIPLKTKQEALILASLIERETGVGFERSHIASVFYNRIRRSWPLQTDPSLIYYESKKLGVLDRPLNKSDLRRSHKYNTYKKRGLPPTPIANPGEASIYAALNPIKTKDFYFVANGKGGHFFSKTLRQHNKYVSKWRKIEKQRKQENQ